MAEQKKKGIFAEFKEFASRGNVLDMAVGVILATAFSKIINALVNNIFMPLIGYWLGGLDFSKYNIMLKEAIIQNGKEIPAVTLGMGTLFTAILEFVLIAFAIFLIVKALNTARSRLELIRRQEKAAAEAATPPEPSNEEKLLMEIRDLLKER